MMADILQLKETNCKNCYKCIRNCPVKSIRVVGHQARIMPMGCVLCGQCIVVCPQNSGVVADATEKIKPLLNSGAPVIASVDPTYSAYFSGTGFEALRQSLRKLGFTDAEDAAVGAQIVRDEYKRLLSEKQQSVWITSSCPSVNLLIRKNYPELVGSLMPVLTPAAAHCLDIRNRNPQAVVVYISPCYAHMAEWGNGKAEHVLTFTQLKKMLLDAGCCPEKQTDEVPGISSRIFSVSGGILKTLAEYEVKRSFFCVDGMEQCGEALDDILSGELKNCLVEMSACKGGCVGGPVLRENGVTALKGRKEVMENTGDLEASSVKIAPGMLTRIFPVSGTSERIPSEDEIRSVMRKMGKNEPNEELNCGACGYNTCREKAVAVCRGKADISMCLPHLVVRSEYFTENIINNAPDGIVILNEEYAVQRINRAAMEMLHIRRMTDIIGEQVVRIMDPAPFIDVMQCGKRIVNQRGYFAEYGKYLEQTITYDPASHLILTFLRDVTDEVMERLRKEHLMRVTAETSDKVVDKQMRIVQEIASLLGETAAETKIALTKLKESMKNERDD